MVKLDASPSLQSPTRKQNDAIKLDDNQRQQEQNDCSKVAGHESLLLIENFNPDLVQETRDLIKHEYETNGGDEKYSSRHYAEIMDDKSSVACWRHLIHRDMKPKDAFVSIKSALNWRKINQVDELTAKSMTKEFWLFAPIGFTGKTRDGLDIVYIVGRNYRKPSLAETKQVVKNFVGHLLNNWDRKHIYSLKKLVAVFDVSNTTLINIDLDFVSWLVTIIDYYPARFEAIHVIGIPFLIRPLIRLIISWLPDRYRRICFCGTMDQLIDEAVDWDQLPFEVDGLAPDTWRLAPREAPWFSESNVYDERVIQSINNAITFNTSDERIEQLKKMQLEHESMSENIEQQDENIK